MTDGVFIEGLKMPSSCADCPCYNAEYLYCNLRNSIDISLDARPSTCWLANATDVRPVVLCRDCVHYEMGVCLKIYDDGAANKDAWQERKPDDFCSYGEKREES